MEKEFDFSAYGKASPYKIPEGFFDTLPQKTLEKAQKRASKHKRITLVTIASLSVAASIALFIAWPFINNPLFTQSKPMAINHQQHFPTAIVDSNAVKTTAPDSSTVGKKYTTPTAQKNTQVVSKNNTSTKKKESIDELLAELTLDELMLVADSGDDDHFIND